MTVLFLPEDYSQSQSNSFGHMIFTSQKKKVLVSVTGDYRTFKHSPCISAMTNNHSGICGFLRTSSIQESKLELWAFLLICIVQNLAQHFTVDW